MTEQQAVGRRTVLKIGGALVAGGVGTSTVSAASDQEHSSPPPRNELHVETSPTGFYDGTVDRIVDGTHVVVLLEEDGRVVGEQVVSADTYPDLAEGDAVSLVMYRGTLVALW